MANNRIALLAQVPDFDTPVQSATKRMQLQALMNAEEDRSMEMQQRRQSLADMATQRSALQADPTGGEGYLKALAAGGAPSAYFAAKKAQQDSSKTAAEIDEKKVKTKKEAEDVVNLRMQRARDFLGNVNTREDAAQWVRGIYSDPEVGPWVAQQLGPLEGRLQAIPDPAADPAGFAKWKMGSQLGADNLVKYTTPDANAKLQSETSVKTTKMTNDTSRANNAATVAQAERASQRSDARARETNNVQREAQQTQLHIDPNLGPILVNKGTKTLVPATFADGTTIPGENVVKAKKLNEQLKAGIALAKGLIPKATASGAGALMDKGAAFFGSSTDGAEAASQLKTLGGWLTANVPRMEGPQSNMDVQQYQLMAADVGNDTLPAARRLAALDTLEKLQAKYADINQGGTKPAGPAQVKTDADYAKLPSGAEYIDPNGVTRRKK